MIFVPRPESTDHLCVKIQFRGFEISIAMDDRSRGENYPLTRSNLMVTKDDEEVTYQVAGHHNTVDGTIEDINGETLFEVMRNIAAHPKADNRPIVRPRNPLMPRT